MTGALEPIKIEKMVVFGFSPALGPGSAPDVLRDPLSGSIFSAEAVPDNTVRFMNDNLFNKVLSMDGFQIVSPGQAEGVYQKLMSSGTLVGKGRLEMLRQIGQVFGAEAVLAGYIYRWQEREGTDFAVNRPASVAFSVNLVNPANGELIWHGKFDKTQRSLSENVFDFETFVKGKGRWMTADHLATLGLDGLLARMPIKGPKKEEEAD